MANKRISELTSITGANLADADLLVVVDVSDTTMASSGTNKKITMAELAKDSALTDNLVAKSTLTTDGDVLTRAAGAPARITRADLAQDSAFSSRYKALASDRLWLPAQSFSITVNTPSLSTLGAATSSNGRMPAWLMDASTEEAVASTFIVPVGWSSADAYIWWSNAGAGAGDVRWGIYWAYFGDAESSDFVSDGVAGFGNVAAPVQYTLKRTGSGLPGDRMASLPAGNLIRLYVRREAANAGDTLANDAGFVGIELVRAS